MPVKIRFYSNRIKRRVRKINFDSLSHIGGYIRKIARNSMRDRKGKPSKPGKPPSRGIGLLRDSIIYDVDKYSQVVIIGPRKSIIDDIGHLHEFGGQRLTLQPIWKFGSIIGFQKRLCQYPARPFMALALKKTIPKIPKFWARMMNL